MNIQTETGTLKKAALFGPPGIESYLAQFYAPEVSLFFDSFDIIKGQSEFLGYENLLKRLNVDMLNLKDMYVGSLDHIKNQVFGAKDLLKKLNEKVPQSDISTLEALLAIDIEKYGEKKAVAVNYKLSLEPDLPMGNIFFARDQSNVLFDTCVISNMKYSIRKPEVAIIYQALKYAGYSNFLPVLEGNFEGGDGMVIGESVYIGVGSRTNIEGASQIVRYFQNQRKQVYLVNIPSMGSFTGDMEIMHLDTFFMPLKSNKAIGCHEVLDGCSVINTSNGASFPFLNHFDRLGYEVLNIPKDEQKNYAANMLVVSPGNIIVPSNYNLQTTETLKKHDMNVYCAELSHLTKAVGATHCMTLQLEKVY